EDVVLPAAIDDRLKFWVKELLKLPRAHAMVHSKIVVIDPFGRRPAVMTGSHNMGPKASTVNDENLLRIEGNSALASRALARSWKSTISIGGARRNAKRPRVRAGRGWQITINGRSEYRMRTHIPKPATTVGSVSLISGSASREAS